MKHNKIHIMEGLVFGIVMVGIFILGVKLGETGKRIEIVKTIEIEYCSIAWWFNGNTLYWAFDGRYKPENYLRFCLDKQIPPTVNQEPIKRIWIMQDCVYVFTNDKYWKLHYSGTPLDNWYVEDWKYIDYGKE